MALALYDQVYVFIDGALLSEALTVATGIESDDQDVATMVKGFSGVSPGPQRRTVKVESAVPSSGFEYPFEKKYKDRSVVEIKLQSGSTGKSMVSSGFFTNVNVDAGVGKATTVSFEFKGEPSIFS